MFRSLRAANLSTPALFALAVTLFPSTAQAKKKPAPAGPPPVRATLPPSATIPVAPLGFAAPGDFYLGTRQAIASLDFLDEDHLLFTFRVPGLFHRDHYGEPAETERHIRAVVLNISDGAVQSEALWTVHDRARYLYMLDNGQFAFRDRDTLQIGDASLQPRPWLHFPGALLYIEFDPTLQYLVASSREPESAQPKPDEVPSPSAAQASVTSDDALPASVSDNSKPEVVLRILSRSSGKVMLVSRYRSVMHVPLNADGYLETLRGRGGQWVLNLDYFTGGTTRVGAVDSTCLPSLNFLSEREFIATACAASGANWLVAFTTDGRMLWQSSSTDTIIWPLLLTSRNGARVAHEALQASHPVSATLPFSNTDIESQQVTVYDAATGKQVLHATTGPILDAGGNVALSPSGRRAAVLMDGNIQIFDLGEAPPAP